MCAALLSKNTAEASDPLRCKRCGKDLMLSIVPKGPGRLLRFSPVTALRCLRCGKRTWTLSPFLQSISVMGVVIVLGLGLMAFAVWRSGMGGSAKKISAPETTQAPIAAEKPTPAAKEEAKPRPVPKEPAQEELTKYGGGSTTEEEEAVADIERVSALPPEKPAAPVPEEKTRQATPPVEQAQKKKGQAKPADRVFLLEEVRAEVAGDALVVLIRTKSKLSEYGVFDLALPPRLVFDAPGNWRYEGSKVVTVGKKGVKRLRIGVHADKLRIVMDLTKTPPEPVVSADPEGLSIILQ